MFGRRARREPGPVRVPFRAPAEVLISSQPLPIAHQTTPPDGRRTPGTDHMIIVTRLNGPPFALNPDLIERADATPDTVLTLVDGTKYLIAESVEEVIASVRDFRASVIARA